MLQIWHLYLQTDLWVVDDIFPPAPPPLENFECSYCLDKHHAVEHGDFDLAFATSHHEVNDLEKLLSCRVLASRTQTADIHPMASVQSREEECFDTVT